MTTIILEHIPFLLATKKRPIKRDFLTLPLSLFLSLFLSHLFSFLSQFSADYRNQWPRSEVPRERHSSDCLVAGTVIKNKFYQICDQPPPLFLSSLRSLHSAASSFLLTTHNFEHRSVVICLSFPCVFTSTHPHISGKEVTLASAPFQVSEVVLNRASPLFLFWLRADL